MSVSNIATNKSVCITAGPGGVGKTTMAAVFGLQAAVVGRKALVITVDPAMRLADALGFSDLEAGKHKLISQEEMQRFGIPACADLTVSMLDTGRSLRQLIRREVPGIKLRKRILEHPFFRKLCNDLAGSREYAAMEEIYYLHHQGSFDILVVDTPPAIQALEFLDAHDRILDVLEHGSYRWLMRPALLAGKIGLKVLDFSGGYVVRTLSRFTGTSFLKELATFVDLFSGLLEGFRQRAAAFKVILRSNDCALVLVTTPDPNRTEETLLLQRQLSSRNIFPGALVINRITPLPAPLPKTKGWKDRLTQQLESKIQNLKLKPDARGVLDAMLLAYQSISSMAARDKIHMSHMVSKLDKHGSMVAVPLLNEDIHNLSGLEKMRKAVFEPGDTP